MKYNDPRTSGRVTRLVPDRIEGDSYPMRNLIKQKNMSKKRILERSLGPGGLSWTMAHGPGPRAQGPWPRAHEALGSHEAQGSYEAQGSHEAQEA